MIKRVLIVTSADTDTDVDKTKYFPQGLCRWHDLLWDILHHEFVGTTVWVHAKTYTKIKNGWYVFFLLNNFLLGSHYVTNMTAQFELNLRRFYYDGEKRGFNLQKFVNLHKGQHIISDGLIEFGYSGVYENSKLHMLRNGIKTNAIDAC